MIQWAQWKGSEHMLPIPETSVAIWKVSKYNYQHVQTIRVAFANSSYNIVHEATAHAHDMHVTVQYNIIIEIGASIMHLDKINIMPSKENV